MVSSRGFRRKLTYFDFFSRLAFLFSLMDLAGFFLTSFLASLDFAITDLPCEPVDTNRHLSFQGTNEYLCYCPHRKLNHTLIIIPEDHKKALCVRFPDSCLHGSGGEISDTLRSSAAKSQVPIVSSGSVLFQLSNRRLSK